MVKITQLFSKEFNSSILCLFRTLNGGINLHITLGTRRLNVGDPKGEKKMANFAYNQNNGTVAVINTEKVTLLFPVLETWDVYQEVLRIDPKYTHEVWRDYVSARQEARRKGAVVFTFKDESFMFRTKEENGIDYWKILSGSIEDLKVLTQCGAAHSMLSVSKYTGIWDGYVPFSNQIEVGIHGEEARQQELLYTCACPWEIKSAFGADRYNVMLMERRERFRQRVSATG